MKVYLKARDNDNSIWLLLLLFLFILISDDTVLFGTNANTMLTNFKYVYIIGMSILLSLHFLLTNRLIGRNTLLFVGMLSLILLLSMSVNNDIRLGYIYKIALYIYALNLVAIYPLKRFARYFTSIMMVLSIVSLVAFVLMYVAPNVIKMLPVTVNIANINYYNGGLFVVPSYSYQGFIRNFGLFREPGVYQMYLIMALLLQLFVVKTNMLFRYIIFVITIITTMSTTGYIALAFFLILFVLNSEGLSKSKRIIFIIILALGIIIIGSTTTIFSLSSENQYISVFGKLTNSNRNTTIARMASITENIRIALKYPFLGSGISRLDELFPLYSLMRYGKVASNTNTITIQFATHGLIYGILWGLGIIKFTKKLNKRYWAVILIIIIILYIGENLTYSGFASIFLMYGISSNMNKKGDSI